MNIDANTVTIIIAIVAFISPIITTFFNNLHQTKIKKLDMYEDCKRIALSEFITAAQAVIFNSENKEFMLKYTSSYDKLFIYFSDITIDTIKPFESARIKDANEDTTESFHLANYELTKLVVTLSKQIRKK